MYGTRTLRAGRQVSRRGSASGGGSARKVASGVRSPRPLLSGILVSVQSASSVVTVACCQLALAVGDLEGNRGKARDAIRAAAAAGAGLILLPELTNSGYMFSGIDELQACAEPVDGPTVREWTRLASELGVIVVGGFAEQGEDGEAYIAAVLIDPTGVRAKYRKTHLWNTEKNSLFGMGSGLPPVVETAVGRIGLMICYDLDFPEWVRAVSLAGADLLCCPSNWPLYRPPEGERPGEIIRAQAAAGGNRMFVAVADRAGSERGQDWLGGSVIVDADGYPVSEIRLGEETIVMATVDLAEARIKSISAGNDVHRDRRPELYERPIED